MAIIVYAHRPKRPAPKKKPSALARAAKAAAATKALPTSLQIESRVAWSRIVSKRLRTERAQQPSGEPSPEGDAFFARNVRPGGPLPPKE